MGDDGQHRVSEDSHRTQQVSGVLRRSEALGFLGSMPIDDQIAHALGFRSAVEDALGADPGTALDLGSGGGVPGLVLATVWPAATMTLLDASERRTAFLQEEVEALGWTDRVKVLRGRAEEVGRDPAMREALAVVVSRSFGSPAVTAECAAPLLEVGGILAVSEPPGEHQESRWSPEGLAQLGLAPRSSYRHLDRFGYQLIEKVSDTPDRYPRRVGIPTKRPLF
jgi:16S rRNA (guanine527-N7)-methyltransferase